MKSVKKNRTTQSVTNVIYGFINQFSTLILAFISRSVFIQVLSVDYLGINGLFTDVLQMLSLADLGFSVAMTYSFYKPLAEKDERKIAGLVHFYKKVYLLVALAVSIVGIAIMPFIKYIVKVEQDIPLLELYYFISLLNVVLSYLFVYKTTLLVADQKNYVIVRVSIITNLLKTIVQIIVLLLFRNYVIYLLIALISTFLNNFWASRKADKEYPFLKDKNSVLSEAEKKGIFSNLKSVFIVKISGMLLNATDNTFISVLVNTAAVGYYSNYLMINNKVTNILTTIFTSITASVGNVVATENEDKRYSVFQALQSASLILCGIIISSYLILINDLIYVWIGKKFMFDSITVIVIAFNLYFACVFQPLWSYREATGLYRRTKYVMLIAAIINLILSFVMGKEWGLKGILLASIIARVLTYVWYEPIILFREYFNKPVGKYYISLLGNVFLIFASAVGVSVLMRNFVIDDWIPLFIKAFIVGVINSLVFIVFYIRTEGSKIILDKFKFIVMKVWKKIAK